MIARWMMMDDEARLSSSFTFNIMWPFPPRPSILTFNPPSSTISNKPLFLWGISGSGEKKHITNILEGNHESIEKE